MAEYRMKPVVVNAIENTGDWEKVKEWLDEFDVGGQPVKSIQMMDEGVILIDTLEGQHRADVGDYIIRGVMGEFRPCKPDIFKITYEEA